MNEGLQKIGPHAFYGCTSLSTITLPTTITEVDVGAFRNCRNLREAILNEGLQKIKDASFYNCISLSSITLLSAVTEIGRNAFSDCNNLREVALHGIPQD